MADQKISALTAATTPLAGTEVLPIVQSGATVKVSVANLTVGRAISATQLTLTTGNLIVASGQGVDFSATPGTGTSELLNDYEQGTWTPVIAGTSSAGTGTYTAQNGNYTKIGNLVTCICYVAWTAHTGTGNQLINGLPFTSISDALYGPVYANINTPLAASNINTNYIGPTNAFITMLTTNTVTGGQAAYALQTAGGYQLSFFYYTN
jgi:hypothetical protein